MSNTMGHLAHEAAPGRHALACDPLTQLETIRELCGRVGHTGNGDVVDAVVDTIQELMLVKRVARPASVGVVQLQEYTRVRDRAFAAACVVIEHCRRRDGAPVASIARYTEDAMLEAALVRLERAVEAYLGPVGSGA